MFWVSVGKEKAMMRMSFLSNLVLKFYNNPTVNESGIFILLKQVWVYVGKRKRFRRERRENKIERKKKRKDISLV